MNLFRFLTSSFFTPFDISQVTVSNCVDNFIKYKNIELNNGVEEYNPWDFSYIKKAAPEDEALYFYLASHTLAELKVKKGLYTPLTEVELSVLREAYGDNMDKVVVRAFYYVLLICTRESRHLRNKDIFCTQLPNSVSTFVKSIGSLTSSSAVEKFLKKPPVCSLGSYIDSLVKLFNEGSFHGGYGGKAWGSIASCLGNFVKGVYTPEVFMDTVWTLCHNNGPIFNKSMLYKEYTRSLVPILDIQRHGSVPNFLNDICSGIPYNKIGSGAMTPYKLSKSKALFELMVSKGFYKGIKPTPFDSIKKSEGTSDVFHEFLIKQAAWLKANPSFSSGGSNDVSDKNPSSTTTKMKFLKDSPKLEEEIVPISGSDIAQILEEGGVVSECVDDILDNYEQHGAWVVTPKETVPILIPKGGYSYAQK